MAAFGEHKETTDCRRRVCVTVILLLQNLKTGGENVKGAPDSTRWKEETLPLRRDGKTLRSKKLFVGLNFPL